LALDGWPFLALGVEAGLQSSLFSLYSSSLYKKNISQDPTHFGSSSVDLEQE